MSFLQESFKTWFNEIKKIIVHPNFTILGKFINKSYKTSIVYPEKNSIFESFKQCDKNELKVVWLCDKPNENSNGIGYGCTDKTVGTPNELLILNGELENDLKTMVLGFDVTLANWAKQGILFLNNSLTFSKNGFTSHQIEWDWFVTELIKHISTNTHGIIWIISGEYNKKFIPHINEDYHHIIEIPEIGADFYGCRVFSQINDKLELMNSETIKWIPKFKTR